MKRQYKTSRKQINVMFEVGFYKGMFILICCQVHGSGEWLHLKGNYLLWQGATFHFHYGGRVFVMFFSSMLGANHLKPQQYLYIPSNSHQDDSYMFSRGSLSTFTCHWSIPKYLHLGCTALPTEYEDSCQGFSRDCW